MFEFREKNNPKLDSRGFCGVAILDPKHESNIGVLARSSMIFGVSFFATIGKQRYKSMSSDTTKSWKHVPFFHFNNFEDFQDHRPKDCKLVGVELTNDSINLQSFCHPERAIYLLGSEDHGIPSCYFSVLDKMIKIDTKLNISLNVSVAGSIVLYDRLLKQ